MRLVEYQAGDELRLRPEVGDSQEPEPYAWLEPERWRWRHRDCPLGQGRALFAWEGERLLGHAASVPTALLLGDEPVRGAQLFFHGDRGASFPALHKGLAELLSADGAELAYAVATDEERPLYEALRFLPLFEVHHRNLYLGLSGVSTRLDRQALRPFRRLAREAWRIRAKLIEVAIDEPAIQLAARMLAAAEREPVLVDGPALELSLVRSESWLRWRFRAPGSELRLLTLRRKAGAAPDGLALVQLFEPKPGRIIIQLLQHATREPEGRGASWLLGEVALWGLVEKADVLQCFAATGSALDARLVSSGCIRKKRRRHLMARWIGPGESPLVAGAALGSIDLQAADVEL